MKKLLSLILALIMVLSMASFASADQGSSVVVGLAGDPGNIGPFQGMGLGRIGILFTTYEMLMVKDGDGFVGCLMKQLTPVDDLTYDVEIYDSIVDQAGNKLTASDIKFCYDTAKADGKENQTTGLQQYVIEKPTGSENLNYVQGDYRLEKQLADMNQAGIDQAVLKLSCQQEWMSLDMCRLFNDGMADHVRRSGGRMAALGVVPPQGTPAVFREIDRCLDDLHFGGLQLSAHYGSLYLDDEAFTPFFAYLNERDVTCYVQHVPVPVQYDSLIAYTNLRRSYGRCIDQATAVGRELFSGFFTKYPNVKLVHSMLGGGFFAYTSLWFPKKSKVKEAVSRFKDDNDLVVEQLKNNLYFEMSHAQPWGKEQLECAVKALGADHILFGTSYPVRPAWLLEGADFVRGLDITEEEKELLLHGNAERLYHL